MRELSINEVNAVSGGHPVATILWGILVGGHEQLNELGKAIGAGIYDATH